MSNKTHFGFKTVDASAKASMVRGVFDSVASKYDLMNDAMSGGLHRLWKRKMVSMLGLKDGMKILDVAGGTGDIAFRMREAANVDVTVCDINHAMLYEGVNRALDTNEREGLSWVCGNAESLPVPDNAFDVYTIAFGIRNVTHIDRALEEAYRVLKIGGRFLCLEFSHIENTLMAKAYDAYSFNVIPRMGGALTGDAAAYQYLVESIRRFPPQREFARMIEKAGFGNVSYRNMMGGVVALHSGRKL